MDTLAQFWLPILCVLAAVGLGIATLVRWQQTRGWKWALYLPAALLVSFGVGGLLEARGESEWLPAWAALTLAAAALGLLIFALIMVVLTGFWSAPLGYGLVGA